MKAFEKVVNPCLCKVNGGAVLSHAYAKIEYDGKRLSISGVVGPTSNGNCRGSCGQCIDEIRGGKPEGLWTDEMLAKFCDVWDRWHLNDMRPYCEHQKELGWDSLATKKVTLYNYSLRTEWFSKQCSLKNHIKNQIGLTGSASITDEEKELWNLPLSVRTWKTLDDPRYEPQKKHEWDEGPTVEKTLGWLRPDEHPEGILCKPCPVCGYEYGSAWKIEPVPEDVLQFLYGLPETTRTPDWV